MIVQQNIRGTHSWRGPLISPRQAATDEQCAPCATGQSWWPCTVAGLCQCAGGSVEPEPEPEPEPESEHSTEPSASPTPSPVTATATPEPTPVPEPEGSKQLVAFVENWLPCPSLDKIRGYDKVIVSFAVSYVWNPTKNQCDQSCNIGMPATCNNQAQPDLIEKWRQAGTKVLLSFGGAGMGGSWAGDVNDCWEYCFGRVDSVVSRLVEIVDSQGFDGVDIQLPTANPATAPVQQRGWKEVAFETRSSSGRALNWSGS